VLGARSRRRVGTFAGTEPVSAHDRADERRAA
jgi:hypothetical protein